MKAETNRTAALFIGILILCAVVNGHQQTDTPQKELPWPSANLWVNRPPIEPILTRAKTVYVQTSLPPAYATLPDWVLKRYTVTPPEKAELWIFVRAGLGGNTNPDILVMIPNQTGAWGFVVPPPPPPVTDDGDDDCRHAGNTISSLSCGLGNLARPLSNTPRLGSWDQFQYCIGEQEKRDLKEAKKERKTLKKDMENL